MSEPRAPTLEPWAAPPAVDRLGRRSLVIGSTGALVLLAGVIVDVDQFFRSYLVGYVFWLAIVLGCLALSMLHHLTGGAWGFVVRRVFEAASRTLPWMLVLFLPLLLGLDNLYLWARAEALEGDHLLEQKAAYLNVWGYVGRLAIYFVVWGIFAGLLDRLSRRQDETSDPRLARRMRVLSAPGLGLYCLAATFASFDWLMSLDPYWYSTIYGAWFIAGHGLAGLAFLVPVALFLARRPPLEAIIGRQHFHDWGKLLLAFVMVWAYFAFSQFLIIWSGNLPSEIRFYRHRLEAGWQLVGLALVVAHFALPFLLLLSRDLKRRGRLLVGVALLILALRWLDVLWQVAPVFHRRLTIHWLDVAAPVALGGFWLWLFSVELRRRPLLPVHDERIEELADA